VAVNNENKPQKYVRGMLTVEAIDNFFEILAWRDTPEDARDYEEPGTVIPECLKLLQKLHEDEPQPQAPPAAPTPASPPAPAPTASAPAPAPAAPKQAASAADDEFKRGYDAGWHHKHRGGDATPPAGHDQDYMKGFQQGFEHGGLAMTVRDNIGKGPEGNKAANTAAAKLVGHAAHYGPTAEAVTPLAIKAGLLRPNVSKGEHPHQPGQDVIHGYVGRESRGKGKGWSPAARDINNFYTGGQKGGRTVQTGDEDKDPNKARPSDLASHIRSSAMNFVKPFAQTLRGQGSATGKRHAEEPEQGGGATTAPEGRPARAVTRPTRVISGGSKDPEGQSPIQTAPAPQPGMAEPERSEVHGIVHDIIAKHPDLESQPGELEKGRDRRKLAGLYYQSLASQDVPGEGERMNWDEHLKAMGLEPNSANRQWAKEIITGMKNKTEVAPRPGFHEILRFDPRMQAYAKKQRGSQPPAATESFRAHVAWLYGLGLTETKGWLTEDAAHQLFASWLSKALRTKK